MEHMFTWACLGKLDNLSINSNSNKGYEVVKFVF